MADDKDKPPTPYHSRRDYRTWDRDRFGRFYWKSNADLREAGIMPKTWRERA